jgi:hypothetical protein
MPLFGGCSIPFQGHRSGAVANSDRVPPLLPSWMPTILDFALRSCRQRCKEFVVAPGNTEGFTRLVLGGWRILITVMLRKSPALTGAAK